MRHKDLEEEEGFERKEKKLELLQVKKKYVNNLASE